MRGREVGPSGPAKTGPKPAPSMWDGTDDPPAVRTVGAVGLTGAARSGVDSVRTGNSAPNGALTALTGVSRVGRR
jgi:hypothetical protein